jgi:thiamine-phosphate pyrophosphorylase
MCAQHERPAVPPPAGPPPGRPLSPLCAIVDADAATRAGITVPDLARAFLAGGARFLQLRAKTTPSGQLLAWCEEIAAAARAVDALLVINDRFDIALLAGVSALHVGQDDLPVAAVRRHMGPDAFIGLSTHTPAQIDDALRQPISYLAIGPVFGTTTKDTGYEAVGLERVRLAARRATEFAAAAAAARAHSDAAGRGDVRSDMAPVPIVAIGGITIDNARSVIEAGAASVAVIGDLLVSGDPARRVREFLDCLAG